MHFRIVFFITFFIIYLSSIQTYWGQVVTAPHVAIGQSNDTTRALNNNPNAIQLINSEQGTFYLNGSNTINVVVGNVIFEHKGERLYADSARLNLTNNTLHAYKNVKITQQDGTICYADYMYYNGETDNVELVGRVQVISGTDNLWSDKIIYNLRTNIGSYNTGGVLQTGTTLISSRYAQYNGNTYDARFKGNVNVEDPEYLIVSSDMNYNTESRIAKFYGPSIIKNDSTILYTTDGYYDTYYERAQFNKRSSIVSQNQYFEADTMTYDKTTSLGIGRGNVVILDSVRKMNIYGQFATLNELTGQAMVTQDPFTVMYEQRDTTWIIADTFFTEPTKNLLLYQQKPGQLSAQDSLLYTLDFLKRSIYDSIDTAVDSPSIDINEVLDLIQSDSLINDTIDIDLPEVDSQLIDPIRGYIDTINVNNRLIDTTSSPIVTKQVTATSDTDSIISANNGMFDSVHVRMDSVLTVHEDFQNHILEKSNNDTVQNENEEPRYLMAYHNVFIYNDSFQAKSDSLRYSQDDTLLILYKNPVLWAQDQQVIGDIIKAFVDSSQIRYVHIPKNGILIAQSTKRNDILFDQVQANEIWAHFSNNEIDSVIGIGNAQTIYYATDESNRYIGVSQASSMHLKMVFNSDTAADKRQLTDIFYYTDHEQVMTPMQQANFNELKLSKFRWRADEKMPDKESFLRLLKNRQYSTSLKEDITEKIQKDQSNNKKK